MVNGNAGPADIRSQWVKHGGTRATSSGLWPQRFFLSEKKKIECGNKMIFECFLTQALTYSKRGNMILKTNTIFCLLHLSFEGCSSNIPDLGLPWWRSGWESACQCGGRGFGPWSGKIPHAAERLGPWATIAEPARLEPVLRNKRGRDSEEARAPRWRVAPTCCN